MDILEQFLSQVDRSGGPAACHPWIGPARNTKGYGKFCGTGKAVVAHRWLLGYMRSRPLEWPEIGCHRCDNPPCCNPLHLYVGTHALNTHDAIERSGHPAAARKAQTHCKYGHEFTPENTHHFGPNGQRRYCRTCKRMASNEGQKKARRARGLKQRTRLANGQLAWTA